MVTREVGFAFVYSLHAAGARATTTQQNDSEVFTYDQSVTILVDNAVAFKYKKLVMEL